KLLVIACNSASAACLSDARERYRIPVVEVIRPAVRRAVAATRNGHVGVIGTAATVTSGAYPDAFAAAPQVTVHAVACPQFVEFVERGITSGRALLGLASGYLEPLQRAGVDTLVLGCTHYPLLAGVIGLVMGDEVTLVSSADETAKDVYRVLNERDLFRPDDAPEAACSAYLVEADGFALMLDFGTGSLSALQRFADLRRIDAILLSHLHCDHILDACSYVVVRRWAPDGPYPLVPVYAPAGARER